MERTLTSSSQRESTASKAQTHAQMNGADTLLGTLARYGGAADTVAQLLSHQGIVELNRALALEQSLSNSAITEGSDATT